jgi:hypothetical protein
MDSDQQPKPHFNPQPDPPAFGLSDRVTTLVVHAGDRLYYSRHDNGTVEYRLIDQGGCHYATFHGHGDHDSPGEFVIDAIGYHPASSPRRELLPVRPQPFTDHYTAPNAITHRDPANTSTYVGDPPPRPVRYHHRHYHPHTDPNDALRIAYHHTHDHYHPGDDRDAHAPRDDQDAALHDHDHR